MKNRMFSLLRSITIDTFFFGISFLVAIVIQPLIVLRLNSLASILFSGLFVLIFVWLFVHIVHRLFRIIKGRSSPSPSAMFSFVLLLFLFIWSGVNVLVQTPTSALSINYLRKLIITYSILISIYLCCYGDFSLKKIRRFCVWACLAVSAVIIGLFLVGIGRTYLAGGLTLNYQNPNFTGLAIVALLIFVFYGLFVEKNLVIKLVYLIVTLALAYLLYLTRCRSAFLALVLAAILYFLIRILKDRKSAIQPIYAALVVFPIATCCLYTILGTSTNLFDLLESLTIFFGKTLTTRLPVWSRAFKLFNQNVLFGSYYFSTVQSGGMSGWQNGELDLLVEQGAIFFGVFIIFCIKTLCDLVRISISKNYAQTIALAMVPLVFLTSIFDSGSFLGISGLFFIFISPMALVQKTNFEPMGVRRVVI